MAAAATTTHSAAGMCLTRRSSPDPRHPAHGRRAPGGQHPSCAEPSQHRARGETRVVPSPPQPHGAAVRAPGVVGQRPRRAAVRWDPRRRAGREHLLPVWRNARAAVSTWLNAGVPPSQVAEWAGHSVAVLLQISVARIGHSRPVNAGVHRTHQDHIRRAPPLLRDRFRRLRTGAPGGTRTHTVTLLRGLPLPLGYGGAGPPYGSVAVGRLRRRHIGWAGTAPSRGWRRPPRRP